MISDLSCGTGDERVVGDLYGRANGGMKLSDVKASRLYIWAGPLVWLHCDGQEHMFSLFGWPCGADKDSLNLSVKDRSVLPPGPQQGSHFPEDDVKHNNLPQSRRHLAGGLPANVLRRVAITKGIH
jgi:hypothetical protein